MCRGLRAVYQQIREYVGALEPVCAALPQSSAARLLGDFSGSRVSFLGEATPGAVFSLGVVARAVTSLWGSQWRWLESCSGTSCLCDLGLGIPSVKWG